MPQAVKLFIRFHSTLKDAEIRIVIDRDPTLLNMPCKNVRQCPVTHNSINVALHKQLRSSLRREGIDMVHIIGPQTAHRA